MNSIEKEFLRSVGFKNTNGSWSVKYNPALDGGTDFGMSRLARLAEAWLDGYDQWRLTISVDDDTKDVDCTMAHSGGVLESNMGGEDVLFNIASCIIGLENPGMKSQKKTSSICGPDKEEDSETHEEPRFLAPSLPPHCPFPSIPPSCPPACPFLPGGGEIKLTFL